MWFNKERIVLALCLLGVISSIELAQEGLESQNEQTEDTATNCPPWTSLKNGTCVCKSSKLFYGKLQCNKHTSELSVLDCNCLTHNVRTHTIEVGSCIENCMRTRKNLEFQLYIKTLSPGDNFSTVNNLTCKRFNRYGRLCGKCLPLYSPQAYSFNITCVKCAEGNKNLWKYLIFSLAPLTCFFLIVLFFKVNTTTSHLHGYIIFAQALTVPQSARIFMIFVSNIKCPIIVKTLLALYGFWNLDFFRVFNLGICLDMPPLSVVALDYIIALCPFLLTILSYILIELYDRNFKILVFIWKPFRKVFTLFRRNWDIRTSVIDAYATFFQLSCFKILCISSDLLIPTSVYTLKNKLENPKLVVYYDGTVDYFGDEHLPYAITALMFTFLFAVLPTLLLLVYPSRCFQHLMSQCHCHSHILKTFVDTLNGSYKDGSQRGTRGCQWFAGFEPFVRFVIYIVYFLTL